MLGDSPQMQFVREQIRRVGPTHASVMLIGESGSGKELAARAVHEHSARADRAFVAINCGAIAPTLIEAELFGHERGSFTGAVRDHAGVFERADGGTLFLDEIAEMPCDLQVRLLRVLETGRFFRVGGAREIEVDVRVIAATNHCLLQAVKDRTLREDLLYRVAVFPIEMPPAAGPRRRSGTAGGAFPQAAQRGARESASSFRQPPWAPCEPTAGRETCRELRNAVERAYILADRRVELAPLQVAARAPGRLVPTATPNCPSRWEPSTSNRPKDR